MQNQKPKLSCGLDTINNKAIQISSKELAEPMTTVHTKCSRVRWLVFLSRSPRRGRAMSLAGWQPGLENSLKKCRKLFKKRGTDTVWRRVKALTDGLMEDWRRTFNENARDKFLGQTNSQNPYKIFLEFFFNSEEVSEWKHVVLWDV